MRTAPRVHAREQPPARVPGQSQIRGPHEAGIAHVDQPVSLHVGMQQHLPFPALEVPQVKQGAGQPQRVSVKAAYLVDGHEHVAPAEGRDEAADRRVIGPVEPDDHVSHAAQ